jgi:hypothetical protein
MPTRGGDSLAAKPCMGTMSTPQIAAISVALMGFAGTVAFSHRFRIRLRVLLAASYVPTDMPPAPPGGIAEALTALGWKAEARKKMQAMRTELKIDAAARKKLEELALRLLG